jgi:acetyl-CoA C-acetyltransferase
MTDVVIAGIGQTPVGEHWELSLRTLAVRAIQAARKDAGGLRPGAMYIGNFLASMLSHQANLGALLAEWSGLEGIEAYTIESAGASGGSAFRQGYLAVASGMVDVAMVVGVEKYNDAIGPQLESALAQTGDYDYEMVQGMTPVTQAAILMQRYMYQYNVPRPAFGEIPLLAHANAVNNPYALFQKPIRRETYDGSEFYSDPLNMFDMAPYADGAAAVILTRRNLLPADFPHPLVRVSGSSSVIDRLALHDRPDPLAFEAAGRSLHQACRQAGILPTDVDFFELCDTFSIYALLSLEAAGYAQPGEAWKMATEGKLTLTGELPIMTMGGLKARGNPIGATGVYQIAEAVLQLRGIAGLNQIPNARRGLVQSLGGPASTVVTHVLERI